MATLGGAQIADRESAFDSGGAFKLSQKSSVSAVVSPSADSDVEVCKGSKYVVGRTKDAADADGAFFKAYDTVQKGLDVLSITGQADLSTRGVFNDSLLWWRGEKGRVLRITSVATMGAHIKGKAMVLGIDGKPVPSLPEETPTYHESLRYFRLSQVSVDVFDSFRNMYLAFESILGYLEPKGHESWAIWLKRALRAAGKRIQLDRVYGSTTPDVIEEIYQQLYADKRCAVFHTRSGYKLFPQDLSDRRKVLEGQKKLARLYIELANKVLGFRYPISWLNPKVHEDSATRFLANSSILISDSDLPLKSPECIDGQEYKTAREINAVCRTIASEPGLVLVEGTATAADLAGLEKIGRIAIKKDREIIIVERLDAELRMGGVDVLEVQLGSRFINMGQTKQQFDS